jgi:uncharacterized protein (UPF0276 family)
MSANSLLDTAIPATGVGLRGPHVEQILAHRPEVGWLEVHPENYMVDSRALTKLERIREQYPLSLHGVGLSLGSARSLDQLHLTRLASLVNRLDPFLVSEHLSWSTTDDIHFNELLPLPYTDESLDVMTSHVQQVQDFLSRTLLIENPANYLRFRHSTLTEAAFLTELVARTDCGLLCDINNLYVSAHNVGIDPADYLLTIPGSAIGEIHLAGHARVMAAGDVVLIDDHGSPVSDDVWTLYAQTIRTFGHRPTLIEWDSNLPALEVLVGEASRARQVALHGDNPSC